MSQNYKLQVRILLNPMNVCMKCRCTLRLGVRFQTEAKVVTWVLWACMAGAEQHCISTHWYTNPPRRTWKKKTKITGWTQEAPPSSLQ